MRTVQNLSSRLLPRVITLQSNQQMFQSEPTFTGQTPAANRQSAHEQNLATLPMEVELNRRDRLLAGIAKSTIQLLETIDIQEAINLALATLGDATGADRVSISENHPHPLTGELATSMRFEWVTAQVNPIIESPHRQNQSYSSAHLRRWYHALTDEAVVRAQLNDLSQGEQHFLRRDRINTIIVAPIIVACRFWGFIELDSSSTQTIWTDQEESTLVTVAANIGAILQRQQAIETIRHQSHHDSLTGLPNRTLFQQELDASLTTARRTSQIVGVLFCNLDRFKPLNDALGNTRGDLLLKAVAQRIRSILDPAYLLARWGTDEFMILLPEMSHLNGVKQIAQAVLSGFEAPFFIADYELFVSASLGIACCTKGQLDSERLLRNANVALYTCKEQSRGSYYLYSNEVNPWSPERLDIEVNLRHAIARNEFSLYYQPEVDVRTNQIVAVEALLRWNNQELGQVPPAQFIPIAEEVGLIHAIGEWVLNAACTQLALWHRQGLNHLVVAVNLSANQFFHADLCTKIGQTLAKHRLEPKFLQLEITESVAIKNIDVAQSLMRQLRQMGIRLAMDDFGTGYSSLKYLKRLPLNTIKIDQAFIEDLHPWSKDKAIVNAVIMLAKSLKMQVIAEGVEEQDQFEMLQKMNCELIQGYWFSPPLPAEAINELLIQSRLETAHLMLKGGLPGDV
jgi:diguanylate cyclase (GGDEF)-like protein